MRKRKLLLPNAGNLFRVNQEADVGNYYRTLVGYAYRRRLQLGIEMLDKPRYSNILEIGYGSGVLLKTLAAMSVKVYGVDLVTNVGLVGETARREGFNATLSQGDIKNLDFPDNMFDAVVCYSVLEHIDDTDSAIRELSRVLKPDGTAVVGFPAVNRAMTLLFDLIGLDQQDQKQGLAPFTEEQHVSGPTQVLHSCQTFMSIERIRQFPRFIPRAAALYFVCKCTKKTAVQQNG